MDFPASSHPLQSAQCFIIRMLLLSLRGATHPSRTQTQKMRGSSLPAGLHKNSENMLRVCRDQQEVMKQQLLTRSCFSLTAGKEPNSAGCTALRPATSRPAPLTPRRDLPANSCLPHLHHHLHPSSLTNDSDEAELSSQCGKLPAIHPASLTDALSPHRPAEAPGADLLFAGTGSHPLPLPGQPW